MVTKSGVWRRTSGLTRAREAVVPAAERYEGLGRLVRQVMEISLAGRESGSGAACGVDAERPGLPGGAGTTLPIPHAARPEGERAFYREENAAREGGVPDVGEWAAVKGDCDPVARVCVKVELRQAQLSVLTKEYCGLSTREVCDAARVARVRPAVRERVIATALASWGRPGLAAQMYCLRGGLLPRQADALRNQRRRRNDGGYYPGGDGLYVERNTPTFGPLSDPGVAYEDLKENLALQLMNAVDASRRAAAFDADAWAVGLGFANFARLKRACVVVLGKSVRQLEWELCAEVVEYWLAMESRVLLGLAREAGERPAVLRARWLFQGHEGPVPAGVRSLWEWREEVEPGWARGADEVRHRFRIL